MSDAILPVGTTRSQTRRTYDRLSRVYDYTEGWLERGVRLRAVRAAHVLPGERVLDIGAGTGWALQRFARAVGPQGLVCALDLSPGMLRVARCKPLASPAAFVLGDAIALPYATATFNVVFMSFVLDLLPTAELPLALREVRRVLRPQGRLVLLSLLRDTTAWGTRLYEWGHRHLPALLDCRPLDPAAGLTHAGFRPQTSRRYSLFGLPVVIVVGTPRGAST